jgi:hypothetical protein
VEDDPNNPFASYWSWTMGGSKAFMPTFNKDDTSLLTDRTTYAQDEFTAGVDKENGIARYSNPSYDNNPEEHTAKNTLSTAGVLSMAEWFDLNHPIEDENGNGYWVGDTDGWYYWSKGLEAGEATALLLDQITLTSYAEEESYYGIHIISEMATAGDWGDLDDQSGFYEDGLTEDGKFLLDQGAASLPAKEKLLYVPMDDTGTLFDVGIVTYLPMDGIGYPNPNSVSSAKIFTEEISGTDFNNPGTVYHDYDNKMSGNGSAGFVGGAGEALTINNAALNFGTNDFTIALWTYSNATQSSMYPSLFGDYNAANLSLLIKDESASPGNVVVLKIGTTRIITTSKTFTPNTWMHYAVVRKDGVFTLYENGVNIGSTDAYKTTNVNLSNNFALGASKSNTSNSFKGNIDDFGVYDYAKYDSNFTPTNASDANVMYSDFEDDPDAIPYNQEPIQENISNSYFSILGNTALEGKSESKLGGASLYFPGTAGGRINKSISGLNFGTKDFTVSFWMNPDATQTSKWPAIFSSEVNASGTSLKFVVSNNGDGKIALRLSTNTVIISTGVAYKPGSWNHYSVVRKDGVFTIYENGINIGSTSSYLTSSVDLSSFSVAGNNATSYLSYYKGYIDDLAVYNYAKYDGNYTVPSTDAFNDPANVFSDKLEIMDDVSKQTFSVVGNANIAGYADEKKFGDASLYFPGVKDQRLVMDVPELDLGTKDFTIAFWINPDSAQTAQWASVFSTQVNAVAESLKLSISDSGNNQITLRASTNTAIISTGVNFKPGVWTHYAVVRRKGVFTIYENGTNIGSTDAHKTRLVNLSSFALGGNHATSYLAQYKGYMDDFVIYNYAVWKSDFTVPTAPGTP